MCHGLHFVASICVPRGMAIKGSMYGLHAVPIAVETQRRRIRIGQKKIKLHLIHKMVLAHLEALIT